MLKLLTNIILISLLLFHTRAGAEDGYNLWLRYNAIPNGNLLNNYRATLLFIHTSSTSPTIDAAVAELETGMTGMLGRPLHSTTQLKKGTIVLLNTSKHRDLVPKLQVTVKDGYIIRSMTMAGQAVTLIASPSDEGILYGVFHLLRLLQTRQSITQIDILSEPRIALRMLNHWDNPDRSVERGYAGISIWNWHTLPAYIDKRYTDYARACASIGINAVSLTNVNANAIILTRPWLEKAKAIADVLRPYGIKIFLTARFSAPVESGKLKTADPSDKEVNRWWIAKANEIYQMIPDFGGFLVKANSEGQPGPQNYGRSHADGANMLAAALAPHNGLVIWRAFVYSNENKEDRHKQAYAEFKPLDGSFHKNVAIQVKNGAIDFQPREPFHPLFGAMPRTSLTLEFQLTQEYLGFATHLVYLAPLFSECLRADTYTNGDGSTVARIIDGSVDERSFSGIAGVSNIGNDINWTGHPFAQANWYAFGRLAWDHSLTPEAIATEWIAMTFTNDTNAISTIRKMMISSREAVVKYMTPLGLAHLMGTGHHYGPAPWIADLARPEWNPAYYHQADRNGIGFNRTSSGTDALSQYASKAQRQWADSNTISPALLLWFHHVSWDHRMPSGRSLWEELCYQYNDGVNDVKKMQADWEKTRDKIDADRFQQVTRLLNVQYQEAIWWRDACVLYFSTVSRKQPPAGYPTAKHTLEYYKVQSFPFAPGN